MENVLGVECFEGISQLREDLDGFLLSKPSFGLDMFGQGSTVTILIDQIVVVGGAQHFHELDDVDVVYLGEDGDLVIGELAKFGRMLEFLHIHHLHCINLLVLSVFSFVDVPVLALSDLLKQDVIFNYLVHFTCILIAKLISISSSLRSYTLKNI